MSPSRKNTFLRKRVSGTLPKSALGARASRASTARGKEKAEEKATHAEPRGLPPTKVAMGTSTATPLREQKAEVAYKQLGVKAEHVSDAVVRRTWSRIVQSHRRRDMEKVDKANMAWLFPE